jgi:site-specific recombinase XerD
MQEILFSEYFRFSGISVTRTNLLNGDAVSALSQTKSGHERVVFVYGDAREVLERLHAGRTSEADDYVFQGTSNREGTRGHLNPEYVSKRFLYYARMAKLAEGIHFHSLRHTYASWLVMAGVDLFRVKELLGHADISTTMRYAHLAPKAFQDELQRVFG